MNVKISDLIDKCTSIIMMETRIGLDSARFCLIF